MNNRVARFLLIKSSPTEPKRLTLLTVRHGYNSDPVRTIRFNLQAGSGYQPEPAWRFLSVLICEIYKEKVFSKGHLIML